MKNTLKKSALALAIVASGNASAALFFDDWGFNPSGTGLAGLITPIDEMIFTATTFVNSTGIGAGETFADTGYLNALGFTNDTLPVLPNGGLGSAYELTATFRDWTGTYGATSGDDTDYVFDAGGTLNIYLDTTINFAGWTGSEDGTNIMSLAIKNGAGNIDFNNPGGVDGNINILFEVTAAAAGYWFLDTDEDGVAETDISTLLGAGPIEVALTDSNANIIDPVPASVVAAFAGEGYVPPAFGPGDIFVTNDGSFALAAVPVPGVLALMGAGFLGLGWMRRKA